MYDYCVRFLNDVTSQYIINVIVILLINVITWK